MIITCTNCQKRYALKPESIGAQGRNVRCTGCGHTWFQEANISSTLLEEKSSIMFHSSGGAGAISSPWAPLTLGWITFFVALALCLSSILLARDSIIYTWPVTRHFYQLLGFKTQINPLLKIGNAIPVHVKEGNKTFVIIKGELINDSKQVTSLPPINIRLQGTCQEESWFAKIKKKIFHSPKQDKCVLDEWRHLFAESRLLPGERALFETPPHASAVGAQEVVIYF